MLIQVSESHAALFTLIMFYNSLTALGFDTLILSARQTLCLCYAYAMLMLCLCYAYAMLMLCLCYAYAMLMLCLCYAYAMLMLCLCYAYAMLMLCLCYAYAMLMLCLCYAYAMLMLCLCYAMLKVAHNKCKCKLGPFDTALWKSASSSSKVKILLFDLFMAQFS